MHGSCRTMYMRCHIISITKSDTCLVQRGGMKFSTLHTPCLEPNTPVMTFSLRITCSPEMMMLQNCDNTQHIPN